MKKHFSLGAWLYGQRFLFLQAVASGILARGVLQLFTPVALPTYLVQTVLSILLLWVWFNLSDRWQRRKKKS